MINDPVAYFITWVTYGTWLPGDQRNWTKLNEGWQEPDIEKEQRSRHLMKEAPLTLTEQQRLLVEDQITTTCRFRNWKLHAVNCRSNHVHIVVTANECVPEKVRADLKAWTTKVVRESIKNARKNIWADRGSIRHIFDDYKLEEVIYYVKESQDKKHLDQQ